LLASCIVQKSHESSKMGVSGPTPGPHPPKCGILMSHFAESKQTNMDVAHCK